LPALNAPGDTRDRSVAGDEILSPAGESARERCARVLELATLATPGGASAISRALGIDRSSWHRYMDGERSPMFELVTDPRTPRTTVLQVGLLLVQLAQDRPPVLSVQQRRERAVADAADTLRIDPVASPREFSRHTAAVAQAFQQLALFPGDAEPQP